MSFIVMKASRWKSLREKLDSGSMWTDKGEVKAQMRELEDECAQMSITKSAADFRSEWENEYLSSI